VFLQSANVAIRVNPLYEPQRCTSRRLWYGSPKEVTGSPYGWLAFLSRCPKIPGYPYLFVLDADGKLLHPQRAIEFEDGDTYNVPRFVRFLTVYGPHSRRPVN